MVTPATIQTPADTGKAAGKPCGDVIPVSPHPGRRILAGVIDGLVATAIGLVVTDALFLVFRHVRLPLMIGALAAAAYVLLRDGVKLRAMDYRSFGKWVMRLRPVSRDGLCVDLTESAVRNSTLAVAPVALALLAVMSLGVTISFILAGSVTILVIAEVFFVMFHPDGRRVGDRLAGTSVLPTLPAQGVYS
jgi:uncharacterized RDD family membrane protein YckC